ncbi:hypothetical protein OAE97_02810 [Verrucomicrobia bacterium]|nr:hypothetical protein [Verrucomicrobiota bacterium]
MKTDTEIRSDGVKALTDSLGEVEAERFVSLLLREPFDYTRWQKSLFPEKSIKEISKAAMELRRNSGT